MKLGVHIDINLRRSLFFVGHLLKQFWIQIQKTGSPDGPGDHHVEG